VDVDELAAEAGFAGFFGGGELALGQGDAALGGDCADGLREADVFEFLYEGEDVAFFVAAEAVEVSVCCVDGEGAGFFFVEGAEAGVVLGAGLAELDVVADDADDVGLLLYELGKIVGHGWVSKSLERGVWEFLQEGVWGAVWLRLRVCRKPEQARGAA
jgi:hypothetical protein